MKIAFRAFSLMLGLPAVLLFGPSTSSHNLTVDVPELNSMTIGSDQINLKVTGYIPGTDLYSANLAAHQATTTFALTSNSATPRYVSVVADQGINDLPLGATITLIASVGTGYTGNPVAYTLNALSASGQHIFSGITKLKIPNGTITYILNAPPQVGPFDAINIQVSYMITTS